MTDRIKDKGRTPEYLIYRACERWQIRPWEWAEMRPDRQRSLFAYELVRYSEGA